MAKQMPVDADAECTENQRFEMHVGRRNDWRR